MPVVKKRRLVKVTIPSWLAVAYIVISIGLVPWTVYLSFALPEHHLSRNWDITWVGFDAALIGSLLLTGILAKMKSIYMVLAAVITGTLFSTDAWFDILSYKVGARGFNEAMAMALLGEIPMAIMSFSLAVHGLRRLHSAEKE